MLAGALLMVGGCGSDDQVSSPLAEPAVSTAASVPVEQAPPASAPAPSELVSTTTYVEKSVSTSSDPIPTESGGATSGREWSGSVAVCSGLPMSAAGVPVDVVESISLLVLSKPDLFAGWWWDAEAGHAVFTAVSTEDATALLEQELPTATSYRVEQVAYNASQLEDLWLRVRELQIPRLQGSAVYWWEGKVSLHFPILDSATIEAVEEQLADDLDAICVAGADPADVPPEGPQPTAGDGWHLLADQVGRGMPYSVNIATNDSELDELWVRARLDGDPPVVDFEAEIVIHFGAVYSGSCPEIRLEGVTIDVERALVAADIVLLGGDRACTDDANPRAYVVAIDRSTLPPVPFTVTLEPDCSWCSSIQVEDLSRLMGTDRPAISPDPVRSPAPEPAGLERERITGST
jgi:hypothetical protein